MHGFVNHTLSYFNVGHFEPGTEPREPNHLGFPVNVCRYGFTYFGAACTPVNHLCVLLEKMWHLLSRGCLKLTSHLGTLVFLIPDIRTTESLHGPELHMTSQSSSGLSWQPVLPLLSSFRSDSNGNIFTLLVLRNVRHIIFANLNVQWVIFRDFEKKRLLVATFEIAAFTLSASLDQACQSTTVVCRH